MYSFSALGPEPPFVKVYKMRALNTGQTIQTYQTSDPHLKIEGVVELSIQID